MLENKFEGKTTPINQNKNVISHSCEDVVMSQVSETGTNSANEELDSLVHKSDKTSTKNKVSSATKDNIASNKESSPITINASGKGKEILTKLGFLDLKAHENSEVARQHPNITGIMRKGEQERLLENIKSLINEYSSRNI